jgi:hypothetical protein
MRGRAVATTADEFGDFYTARLPASDLKRYREKGPRPWTRTLIESLKADGVHLGAAGMALRIGRTPASPERGAVA